MICCGRLADPMRVYLSSCFGRWEMCMFNSERKSMLIIQCVDIKMKMKVGEGD